MSRAKDISIAICERLAQITIANGYKTDIGNTVFRGKASWDESKIPYLTVFEADDNKVEDKPRVHMALIDQQFYIEANVACDPDNPNDAAHDAVEDMQKALLGNADTTLGGLVQSMHYTGKAFKAREGGLAYVVGYIGVNLRFPIDFKTP